MKDDLPPLTYLARMARGRDTLLANLLYFYQEAEGMSDDELAAFLQCEKVSLPRLALCRRPRPAPQFRADVEQIARFTGANPFQLMRLIRTAEARQALEASRSSSVLLAARDHDEPDDSDELDRDLPRDTDDG